MDTAIVAIHTDTLQLLIVDHHMNRVIDSCRFGHLGEGLVAGGKRTPKLDPEAIARSLEICREYRVEMDAKGVGAVHAIATHALGEAANAQDFVTQAEEVLGARIEIITQEREAELVALAVARAFPELATTQYLVVDVGGDSTRIVSVDGGRVLAATGVPIGAAQLSRRYLRRHDPPTGADMNAVERAIDGALKPVGLPRCVNVVGTGRTATTIGALELGLRTYDPDRVNGVRMVEGKVASWMTIMSRVPLAQRMTMGDLDVERAEQIVGGAKIYARLLTWVRSNEYPTLITSDRGVCWGLAYARSEGS